MQLPRVCVHFRAHTALIQGSAHLTPPRPQHSHLSWLISHFPMGSRPLLTEEHTFCTSVIHSWHGPVGQPASNRGHHPCHEWARDWPTYQPWHCHERLHVNIGVSFSLPCSCIPRALSTYLHWGSLLPMMTLDLVTLAYELGSQLWHTGSVRGRKQVLFLNLMEIYFGSQDLKLPFFVSCLTGRRYVCAQSHRTALDETCTSSCQ